MFKPSTYAFSFGRQVVLSVLCLLFLTTQRYKHDRYGQGGRTTKTMKSNLNKTEFKKRLTELTSKEKDFYFITPYNSSGTPFCGEYDDRTFELTRNSFWQHVKVIVIKGEYNQLDNDSTEVSYALGWTKFTRNLFIVFISLAFVGLNTFLIVFSYKSGFKISSLLIINGFLAIGCLLISVVNWTTKKIVNQRFKEEFEIGLEDEWEKLAASNSKGHVN